MTVPNLDVLSAGLGRVYNEKNNINVKFWEATAPFGDSAKHIAINAGGKVRLITVQGVATGEGYSGADIQSKIADFVYEMEAWVNSSGGQSRANYTDSLNQVFRVIAVSWDWNRSQASPNQINYTIIMKEVA